jgi:carbon-monoxide dehydrogenase medium subunit
MLDIDWLRPTSITEAAQMLAEYGEEGKLVAGGTWVTLVLKQKLLMPMALISLAGVPSLKEINFVPGDGLYIGALATHREIETSAVVRDHFPVLAETFATVANVRIRNQATLGGVLCDADYASDPPATLAALNAMITAHSLRGERKIPVREFITGHYTTLLEADEIVTQIFVPEPPEPRYGVYLKYRTRSHEDRPCVGVAVVLGMDPDSRCRDLRVVVGAVSDRPRWVASALEIARDQKLTPDLVALIASQYEKEIEPLSDLRASSVYRRQMVGVFVRRGIEAAVARAGAGGAIL